MFESGAAVNFNKGETDMEDGINLGDILQQALDNKSGENCIQGTRYTKTTVETSEFFEFPLWIEYVLMGEKIKAIFALRNGKRQSHKNFE